MQKAIQLRRVGLSCLPGRVDGEYFSLAPSPRPGNKTNLVSLHFLLNIG